MFAGLTILAAPFLQPGLAAAGAGLAAVPIIIHLLNRRRFRRIIWAAMGWLLAAQRKNARRIRIEQLLLLLIRCLIMLLIALAIARPILGAMGLGRLFGQDRTVRVIVLDDSYSMNYGMGGGVTSPFEKARKAAVDLVDMFDPDDAVAVVLAGAPARLLIEQPSYDHKAVREAIGELPPTCRGTDLTGAFKLTLGILDRQDAPVGKQVFIIADRSRSAWQPGGSPLRHPAETGANWPPFGPGMGRAGDPAQLGPALDALAGLASVSLIDVGAEEAANLAVTGLTARYEIRDEREVRVVATVHNFSPVERRGLAVRLILDPHRDTSSADARQRMVEVPPIPPGKSARAEDLVQFAEAGFHTIHARLVAAGADQLPDDLLDADNERFFSMLIRSRVNVMLVDGQPGRRPVESEVFGLSLALAPITKTGREGLDELKRYTLMPRIETAPRPAPGWLNDVDLVVLANLDLLATAEVPRVADDLAQFVRRGGGLLLFLGNQTDSKPAIDAYNKLFYRDGAGPLPGKLVSAVGLATERREGEHLLADDLNHPVLVDFKAKAEPLRSARFFRHVKVELAADSDAAVLLKYSGGDPAIVLKKFGEGKVALVTTSADGDWNSFYGKPDYLPLFNQLAYFLAPAADASRNLPIGSALAEPLSANQAGREAELAAPPARLVGGGSAASATAVRRIVPKRRAGGAAGRKQFLACAENLDRPGFYSLKVGASTAEPTPSVYSVGAGGPLAEFVYAVNPPAEHEGDLRSVDRRVVQAVLGEEATILAADQLTQSRQQLAGGTEVSRTLLYIVLALCLLETYLAQKFGHFRE